MSDDFSVENTWGPRWGKRRFEHADFHRDYFCFLNIFFLIAFSPPLSARVLRNTCAVASHAYYVAYRVTDRSGALKSLVRIILSEILPSHITVEQQQQFIIATQYANHRNYDIFGKSEVTTACTIIRVVTWTAMVSYCFFGETSVWNARFQIRITRKPQTNGNSSRVRFTPRTESFVRKKTVKFTMYCRCQIIKLRLTTSNVKQNFQEIFIIKKCLTFDRCWFVSNFANTFFSYMRVKFDYFFIY